MSNSLITADDMEFLAKQSSSQMNMIIAEMTLLINDNEKKAKALENQTWFQRMSKTINGKNKMTEIEINQNHDRLNIYLTEALAELYERNCIDHEIIISLGNQINEVYASQLQLKQMLGMFAFKLNEKIESVDNFHMLCSEIEQGLYSDDAGIINICRIISQLDKRSLTDNRKMGIIERALTKQGILTYDENNVNDYLLDIINLAEAKVGLIYLELGNLKGNIIADMMVEVIENYHLLASMTKKMTKKDYVIDSVLKSFQIDDTVLLSLNEIYEGFITTKIELVEKFDTINPNEITVHDDSCNIDDSASCELEEKNYADVQGETEILVLRTLLDTISELFDAATEGFINSIKELSKKTNIKKTKDLTTYRNNIVNSINSIYGDDEDTLRTTLRSVDEFILQAKDGLEGVCDIGESELETSFNSMLDEIVSAVDNFDTIQDLGVEFNSMIVSITELQLSSFECQVIIAKQTLKEIEEAIADETM